MLSRMDRTAGPTSTMKTAGMMQKMSGTVMITGRRAAFYSTLSRRSLRNSTIRVRMARENGVP